MNTATPDSPILISIAQEGPFERFKRGGIVLVLVLAALALAFRVLGTPAFLVTAVLGGLFFLDFAKRYGRQRMLIMREHDLYTVGGEIDHAIAWAELEDIETVGRGAELIRQDGVRFRLKLDFLGAADKIEMITQMTRYLEIFRVLGPLRLPDITDAEIRSGRISLRHACAADMEFLVSLAMAEDRHDYQLTLKSSRELAERALLDSLSDQTHRRMYWNFVIRRDDTPIGAVSVHIHDPILRHAQLGINLLEPFRGKGHGSKAIRALIRFLREETNLERLSAGCFSDNHRCRRALEKAGLEFRGILTRFWFKGSEWKDGAWFELVFSDPTHEPPPPDA